MAQLKIFVAPTYVNASLRRVKRKFGTFVAQHSLLRALSAFKKISF